MLLVSVTTVCNMLKKFCSLFLLQLKLNDSKYWSTIKSKTVVVVAGWACLLCCWACMCCGSWAGQTSATAEHAEYNNNNNNSIVNYQPEHKRWTRRRLVLIIFWFWVMLFNLINFAGSRSEVFLEYVRIPESSHDTVPHVSSLRAPPRDTRHNKPRHRPKLRSHRQKTEFSLSNELVQRYITGDSESSEQGTRHLV